LFRMRCDDPRRVVIGGIGGRALRLVITHGAPLPTNENMTSRKTEWHQGLTTHTGEIP
jgi:hypothetical protein